MNTKYSKYKSSGVEWIGEIPSHWTISKTKYLTKNLDGQRVPLSSEERGDRDKIFPYWGSNGVIDKVDKFIFDGEFVLVGEDGSPFFDKLKDVSFYINGKVWVNNHIHILKPYSNINPLFLTHSFNNTDYRNYITGSTRDKLTQSDLNIIVHVLPPLSEQEEIVKYLDEKTTQVDNLISITEKKIDVLKEKRTSLINTVVTKGLNPKVELKESGVEWIGEIPKHWGVSRLRFVTNRKPDNGIFKKRDEFGEGVKLINVSDLFNENNLVKEEQLERVSLEKGELEKYGVENGDMFFVRSSLKLEGIGVSSMIDNIVEPCVFECHVIRIKPNKKIVNPYYLLQLLNSQKHRNYLVSISQSTTMTTISQDMLINIPLVIPPIGEQNEIIKNLDTQTKQIDTLISIEKRRIETLKEYRKSLISEVVTGKVRVCEEVSEPKSELQLN